MQNSKRREILEQAFKDFQISIGNTNGDEMTEKAYEYFDNAMEKYAEYYHNEKTSPTLQFNPENCVKQRLILGENDKIMMFGNYEDAVKYILEQQKIELPKE